MPEMRVTEPRGWRGRLGRPPRVVRGAGAALRPADGGREPGAAGAVPLSHSRPQTSMCRVTHGYSGAPSTSTVVDRRPN